MKHPRAASPYSIWLNGRFSRMRKRRSSMRFDIVRRGQQWLPERIAGAPAPHRHRAVLRQDSFAVMERQTVAQGECPGQPIGRYIVSRAHLRTRLAHVVEAIQRVEHHVPVDSRDQGGGPDRIDRRKARVRNVAQRPSLGVGQSRRHQRGCCLQKIAAPHNIPPPDYYSCPYFTLVHGLPSELPRSEAGRQGRLRPVAAGYNAPLRVGADLRSGECLTSVVARFETD